MLRQPFNPWLVIYRPCFFFSREESLPRVHVSHPDGEAKFWLSPTVQLARNIGLSSARNKEAERLLETRQLEIIHGWSNAFAAEVVNISGHCVWVLVNDAELGWRPPQWCKSPGTPTPA
jgi:hypothetical protein